MSAVLGIGDGPAFFSFVSNFDQTRQPRKDYRFLRGAKSACWAGLFLPPEDCQQDGDVPTLPLNNWQPVPSVGKQYQSRQLLEKSLEKIRARASTNARDTAENLGDVIGSALSVWADRFREGASTVGDQSAAA